MAQSIKYLTFNLEAETYGMKIVNVKEIIGLVPITAVPKTPVYFKGIMNLRGNVIPVLDLRLKLGMDEKAATGQTCIIVVETAAAAGRILTGVIVDSVADVLSIESESVEEKTEFGSNITVAFIAGIAKVKDRVVLLLDIDAVIGRESPAQKAA